MTVRRTKASDPIVALSGYERIEISPSANRISADDLNGELARARTPKEALEVIRAAQTPEEAAAYRDIAANLVRSAIGPAWLDQQERIANGILERSDPPDFSDDADRAPGTVTYGIELYPSGSPAWYASSIVGHIRYLRRLLDGAHPGAGIMPINSDPPTAEESRWLIIDAAMRLSSIWTEAKINGAFGKALGTGLKQRAHLRDGSSSANARKRQRAAKQHLLWTRAAAAIWKTNDKLSTSRCAERVIKNLNLSRDIRTVADAIRHLQPKKVGNAR